MLCGAEIRSDSSRSHSRAVGTCLVCSQLPRHEDVMGSDGITSCAVARLVALANGVPSQVRSCVTSMATVILEADFLRVFLFPLKLN